MDTGKWTQEIGVVKSMADIAQSTCSRPAPERKVRPHKDQAVNCPRCNSTNTKFCYYNNYSLTQPRYFCKTCRRYWTEGGTLRNVPVGGGSRKNKKSSSSITTITAPAAATQKFHDVNPPSISQYSSQNSKTHQNHDLSLTFPGIQSFHGVPQFLELAKVENSQRNQLMNTSSSSSMPSTPFSTLELLKTGIESRELNSFISTPVSDLNALYTSGFPFQEMKPNFSVEGLGSRYEGPNGVQDQSVGKLMFPFGAMKQHSSTNEVDQSKGQGSSAGYWNGMLGGGSW